MCYVDHIAVMPLPVSPLSKTSGMHEMYLAISSTILNHENFPENINVCQLLENHCLVQNEFWLLCSVLELNKLVN